MSDLEFSLKCLMIFTTVVFANLADLKLEILKLLEIDLGHEHLT